MVGVIVELHPLVSASFASSRLDHRPCLCCLQRVVITTKAFAIDIVAIVYTVVWQIECLVIVLDGLQLEGTVQDGLAASIDCKVL